MIEQGTILDGYRILSRIGEGSYGTVFSAENLLTGQVYALKIVSLTGRAGQRELRALSQYRKLTHPNLIRIYHAGESGDFLYYTMDLAEGRLADQHLTSAGLCSAAIQLTDALDFLHKNGLLHRDIKPDNLLWIHGKPVLADIGLMTPASGNVSVSGTFAFLPPRVWKEKASPDEQSDLYALGKSFYCLISGNQPQQYPDYGGTLSPEIAPLFRAVLDVCDEHGKIHSASDFREQILSPEILPKEHCRKKIWRYGLILVILVLCTFISIVLYRRNQIRKEEETFRKREEIREQAQIYAERKIPYKTTPSGTKYTNMNDVLARDALRREYLEKH